MIRTYLNLELLYQSFEIRSLLHWSLQLIFLFFVDLCNYAHIAGQGLVGLNMSFRNDFFRKLHLWHNFMSEILYTAVCSVWIHCSSIIRWTDREEITHSTFKRMSPQILYKILQEMSRTMQLFWLTDKLGLEKLTQCLEIVKKMELFKDRWKIFFDCAILRLTPLE